MIRPVNPITDSKFITRIYNHYVLESTATFDLTPLTVAEMYTLVSEISAEYPFFVDERHGAVTGFCYAHPWKAKQAYAITLESTVYVAPGATGLGIGRQLMEKLIDECAKRGYESLIACITAENNESLQFHGSLGFVHASTFVDVGMKFGRKLSVIDMQLHINSSAQ